MDVKSIIQKWYKELAEDAANFEEQAQRVSIWDQQLRENQNRLETIVDNVHRIMSTQSDLKTSCDTIEAYQNELENDLTNLSNSLDVELEDIQLQEPTIDDCERESTYLLAEDLNTTLNQMELNLKKVINDLQGGSDSQVHTSTTIQDNSVSNPIEKIVMILNHHHESLLYLDEKSNSMQKEINLLNKELNYRSSNI